ncbi:MAG: hypothetical protein LH477_17080 [Nocardioides sp.]|nr:hypothetical protein [Nocardioides sp.]
MCAQVGRFFVGAGGVVLSGVGSWALIGGTDGAGTVAVFIAGVILICLSAAGVLPQKIWGKDMGLIIRRARAKGIEEGKNSADLVASHILPPEQYQTFQRYVDQIATPDNLLLIDSTTNRRIPGIELSPARELERQMHQIVGSVLVGLPGVTVVQGADFPEIRAEFNHRVVGITIQVNLNARRLSALSRAAELRRMDLVIMTDDFSSELIHDFAREVLDRQQRIFVTGSDQNAMRQVVAEMLGYETV